MARLKEMSSYRWVIKYYIGQGLIRDADLAPVRIEAEEAEHEAGPGSKPAFKKIGIDSDKAEAFWKEWGVPSHRTKGRYQGLRRGLRFCSRGISVSPLCLLSNTESIIWSVSHIFGT